MKVVGEKLASDNHYYARVEWVAAGGPADKAGILKGEKVGLKLHLNLNKIQNKSYFKSVTCIIKILLRYYL